MAFVLLVTLAFRPWLLRVLACAVMLLVLIWVWHRVQPPWWDTAADVAEMLDNQQSNLGYEGTDEYVPAGADAYEINKDAQLVAFEGDSSSRIHIIRWAPEHRSFTASAGRSGRLVLKLFNYPAWQTAINGRPVETGTVAVTGQISIPVAAGENQVDISFTRTPDRMIGWLISFGTMIAMSGWVFIRRRAMRRPTISRVAPSVDADTNPMRRILIATSNPGKLRDFAGAASSLEIEVASVPYFASLEPVVEDGTTFEANARKKAESYSRHVPGEIVLADDSGLEVDALGGAPGVHSARYAADQPHLVDNNTDDHDNNARLVRELRKVTPEKRTGRFVCVIAAARDGEILAVFRGEAEGLLLDVPRGSNGFGYDPLFYFPSIQKTFAELTPEEKAQYSHRGKALREFAAWISSTR